MPMRRPVFVIGSPRSGTTLLHHMLLSAGGFAVYETESNVFSVLVPTFGDFRVKRNRQRMINAWVQSELFRLSGLPVDPITGRMLAECENGGDFLRILMEEIANRQQVDRWSEHTPSHLLHLPEIKAFFPDALIVHVIRDGRDVALSLAKPGWVKPLPWHKHRLRVAAALYWEWMVRKGRDYGKTIGPDYLEIRYEDLVQQPRTTLASVSRFIDHELDYDQIQRVAIGSVGRPNTSFESEHASGTFRPVGRWQRDSSEAEIAQLESLIGDLLQELGYPLASVGRSERGPARLGLTSLRALYQAYYGSMLWLKKKTPLHRYFASRDIDQRLFT